MKVHIWSKGCHPNYETSCGKTLPADRHPDNGPTEWGGVEGATCLRCLSSLRNYSLRRTEHHARNASEASATYERVSRAHRRRRRRNTAEGAVDARKEA